MSVSEGEAQAVLQEGAGAGKLLLKKLDVEFAAPTDADIRAGIRPVPPLDGHHYCEDDWHVILIAFIADNSENPAYTEKDAKKDLEPIVIKFVLDGQPLTGTKRTPVKRIPDVTQFNPPLPGVTRAYFLAEGHLMAPKALAEGEHTLSYTAVGAGTNEAQTITFVIDAHGTGACAQ